jgi:HK97 family phage major capsid protein
MANKMPLATLVAVAKSEGYTGPETDAEAMKKHLLEHPEGAVDTITYEGEKYTVKDLVFDPPPAQKPPRSKEVLSPPKPALPADFDEKVKHLAKLTAKEMLSKAGYSFRENSFEPITPESTPVRVGKSMQEVIYENDIKRGTAFFSSYGNAMLAKHYLDYHFRISDLQYGAQTPLGVENARKSFLEMHEKVVGKAYTTTSVTGGAALMPEAFIPDLIRNVTEAGVARRLARVVTMSEGQVIIPRRTGGITIYFPQESVAPTESSPTTDDVVLSAKTAMGLTQASNQSIQDSGISILDFTFQEFATAIAQKEDDCLLVGDATSTFGGMTGFESTTYFGTTATDGGNVVVGATTSDAHTAAQIASAIARVPPYARRNMVFTGSTTLVSTIFHRLQTSTPGGMTLGELEGFGLLQRWMGIPIIENNSMSVVNDAGSTARGKGFTAGDQIDLFLGDFSRAAIFGDRMQVEMSISRERGFDTNSAYLRVVERFHSVVHSIGTSTTAGPVVSFWQT